MRFFVIGLAHTKTVDPINDPSFAGCAYTAKAWYLCRMLTELGHEVYHVGNEGSNPICTRQFTVGNPQQWQARYGGRRPTDFFDCSDNDYTANFYRQARRTVYRNGGEPFSSIVCLPFGQSQRLAVEGLSQIAVETGIGYGNAFLDFRVYESYAWLHHDMGRLLDLWEGDVWNWAVIPSAKDVDVWGPIVPTAQKENYFLCVCRMNADKGVGDACEVARKLGVPIKLIGQGNPGPYLGPGVEYIPPVAQKDLVPLLCKARGLFSYSHYPEPFGNIAVEGMLCGCPCLSTDFGVYPETVIQGKTGFRCRSPEQLLAAARRIDEIDSAVCRAWAVANYGLERVGRMYEEYFAHVSRTVRERKNVDLGWLDVDHSMLGAKP
jgi:glycosyltransferase involved in cell wall biosynthesis